MEIRAFPSNSTSEGGQHSFAGRSTGSKRVWCEGLGHILWGSHCRHLCTPIFKRGNGKISLELSLDISKNKSNLTFHKFSGKSQISCRRLQNGSTSRSSRFSYLPFHHRLIRRIWLWPCTSWVIQTSSTAQEPWAGYSELQHQAWTSAFLCWTW